MRASDLEHNAAIRIKFASLQPNGHLVPDCHDEYDTFASEAPPGWTVKAEGQIETRFDHLREAWLFSDDTHQIAAVEHETGVEILVAVGVGVASSAVVGFTKWAWSRWQTARGDKPQSAFVAERVHERTPNGTERVVTRVTVSEPTAEDIAAVLSQL